MKLKILNVLILIFSLFGYLEWGNNQHSFLYRVEWDVISKLFSDPLSALHPLIIVPLIGQILLLLTLVQRRPNKYFTIFGILALAILFAMLLLVGILSANYKILLSVAPFFALAFYTVFYTLRHK
ncbi:MAG: hypothetical protein ACK5NT_12490 [Pyrinomonadaceae bacterium]